MMNSENNVDPVAVAPLPVTLNSKDCNSEQVFLFFQWKQSAQTQHLFCSVNSDRFYSTCTPTCRGQFRSRLRDSKLKCNFEEGLFYPDSWILEGGENQLFVRVFFLFFFTLGLVGRLEGGKSLLSSPTSAAVVSPISPDVFPKGVRELNI